MFLTVLANVLNVILAPLEIVNIGVDFVSSLPVVSGFIQVITYLLPWNNLIPLFAIVFGVLAFKFVIGWISAMYNLLPFIGH